MKHWPPEFECPDFEYPPIENRNPPIENRKEQTMDETLDSDDFTVNPPDQGAIPNWYSGLTPMDLTPMGLILEDPWIHRSEHMRCSTCMWYARKDKGNDPQTTVEVGRCRRHAPTMIGYPVVFTTDWCGDHKLNERAI